MILNQQKTIPISLPPLKLFLKNIQQALHIERAEISIAFVTDAAIAEWNQEYRGKPGPTDVLSFPATTQSLRNKQPSAAFARQPAASASNRQTPQSKASPRKLKPVIRDKNLLGDIAIAPATALRYAAKNHRTLDSEVRVLILHGVLHLMGYDHERDHGEMHRLEQKLRRRLGLA